MEHLPAGEDVLKNLKPYLKQSSKVLIYVPNYASFGRKFFSKYWLGYQPHQHLWFFTPKTLTNLLKSKEYNIEKLALHSLGKGIDDKNKYVYDSAGYFLSSTNILFRLLNFALNRIDFLLERRLGKFIRQYKEKEFGDGIFALITLNSKTY